MSQFQKLFCYAKVYKKIIQKQCIETIPFQFFYTKRLVVLRRECILLSQSRSILEILLGDYSLLNCEGLLFFFYQFLLTKNRITKRKKSKIKRSYFDLKNDKKYLIGAVKNSFCDES